MSRIGKQPIAIAQNVDVTVNDRTVTVKGPNGEMAWTVPEGISANVEDGSLIVSRSGDDRQQRALHGLSRAMLNNMVQGVTQHFEKRLEIQGVGYTAQLAGNTLRLQVGFANTVELPVPERVICELPDATHIICKSMDKQAVGQFAADIRRVRPPEPYKGKGIRYAGEQIRRKAGKAFAGGGG